MAGIYRERTARTEHRCAWNCGVPIRPGDRYVISSFAPHDNDIGNIGWWHLSLHGLTRQDCPTGLSRTTIDSITEGEQ